MPDVPEHSALELLLLATERQVHAFDLATVSRVKIGRHEANDLQLTSRTVSNFHAEIIPGDGQLVLRDLGSTNGTYINDRRVENATLASGDHIRIGNHLMTMQLKPVSDPDEDGFIYYKKAPESFGPGTEGRIISMRSRPADTMQTLRGESPNDLSFPDLLKILTANHRTACVTITRDSEEGRVWIRKNVVHAELDGACGEKALYRLFGWKGARYRISELPNPDSVRRTIVLPTETLILEGTEHARKLGKLIAELPPLEARLRLKEDCPLPMTAHSSAEIEIFQLIIRHETIGRVLQKSVLTDIRILRLVDSLLRKGVFDTANSSDSFEDTLLPFPRES